MKPAVLLTRRIPAAAFSRLTEACDVEVPAHPPTAEDLRSYVRGKRAVIAHPVDRITPEVLDAGDGLEIVANVAVGYDNIDLAAAKARNVIVTNTPDVLTEAVAEFTWGLILSAARRITEGDRLIRRGGWKGWSFDFMLGTQLRGGQLGIIGPGRIGRAVAAKAPAFGMTVAFAGRRRDTAMSLDELLVSSDVISLHAPLTPETRHMIDRRTFARMKRSAIFVNTSRGALVDEEALAWALQERLIAAAALDVYEREPVVLEMLLSLENVVLAPHLGSATRETRTAMADLAVSNVLAVLKGEPPLTPV